MPCVNNSVNKKVLLIPNVKNKIGTIISFLFNCKTLLSNKYRTKLKKNGIINTPKLPKLAIASEKKPLLQFATVLPKYCAPIIKGIPSSDNCIRTYKAKMS